MWCTFVTCGSQWWDRWQLKHHTSLTWIFCSSHIRGDYGQRSWMHEIWKGVHQGKHKDAVLVVMKELEKSKGKTLQSLGTGWRTVEVLWSHLCSHDSWPLPQNCWTTPQLEDHRTCRAMENPRTCLMELLVAKHVTIYRTVLHMMERCECQFYYWTPRITWVWCDYGHSGLGKQMRPFYSYSHHCHSAWGHPALPPAHLETSWASEINTIRSRITIHCWIHVWTLLPTRYFHLILHGIPSTVRWPDQMRQPRTRTVYLHLRKWVSG